MGLLSSLIGGIFGLRSGSVQSKRNLQAQREANETNLQIAQMNNDYNREMFDKQIEYNNDMWDKQSAFSEQMQDKSNAFQKEMWELNNEYNSASAQASRLRQAGFNPYMMMNAVNAGTASFSGGSMASTPGTNGVTPAFAESVRVNPVMQDGSIYNAIQDMITNVMDAKRLTSQTQLIDEQARGVGIENKYKAQQIMADLAYKMENTKNTKLRNMYQKIMNFYAKDMFQNELNKGRQEYAIGQMQENIMATDYAMKQLQLSAMPYQIQLGISREIAQIGLISAQKGYTVEQTRKAAQEKLESLERTEGIKLSNKERKLCMDAAVRLAEAKADEAEFNRYPDLNSLPAWLLFEGRDQYQDAIDDYRRKHWRGGAGSTF